MIWSKSGLTNAFHTVEMQWTGTHPLGPQPIYLGGLPPHNPAALVNVDAFDVTTPDPVTLTYQAGLGGSISGDADQTIPYGDDGTEVIAVPDLGYEFANWSDGFPTATRTDTNVTTSATLIASFISTTTTTLPPPTTLPPTTLPPTTAPPSSPVPASSTWTLALLALAGIGLIGTALRTRSRRSE